MLQTFLKIGEWQSQRKTKWDRFLDIPKVDIEDKKGNPIKNYTLPIIFDLDKEEVIIAQENLEEYDDLKVKSFLPIKLKGWKSNKIVTAVPSNRLNYLYLTNPVLTKFI